METKWGKSKTVLSNKSNDTEYILKKKVYSTTKVQHTFSNSVLLYEDEKGPITTKTHGEGGSSWSSVWVKTERAQKIKYFKCV
jgi:hypothetical protein